MNRRFKFVRANRGARGETPRATSLGPFDEGFVAETCSTPGTAAFRLRALAENPGARSRDGFHHRLLSIVLAGVLASGGMMGCDLKGGGSTETPEGPPKPEYERAFDEFADVPNQITAHVVWAAEPIDHAILLADEIAALRTKLNIDAATFASMCTVAFKDGKIEIGAQAELQAAKAEIEATLKRIQEVGKELQGLPDRIKVAGKGIGKLVTSTPKLVLQAGKELSGELSIAVGDSKVQIEADIQTVKNLPNEVKTQAVAAKDVLAKLPEKAQKATTNLLAAMKGEPYEPLETTGEPTDASADTGTQIADAGGTGGTGGTGAVPPPPSSGGTVPPPPNSGGSVTTATIPAELIARRVKQLDAEAAAMGKRGDWLSAANAYEEAYTLDPENWGIAFKVGDAATRAKDCARAQTYFERFSQYASPSEFLDKIQAAKRALGELQTFECPARTPQEEALVAETLVLKAKSLGAEGDWTGAAVTYLSAYRYVPGDPTFAFEVAVAAWKAQACTDAVSYFYYFLDVADPNKYRKQIGEANRYIDKSESGECVPLAGTDADARARALYTQGQELELALDYLGAAGKYERAYELLPANHSLGFRAAESYWAAQRCKEADPHYRNFVGKADAGKFANEVAKSQGIVARIDAHGCPNALWNEAGAAVSSTSGGGGGGASTAGGGAAPAAAGGEEPPASGGGGGGSAHCSVGEDSRPAGAIGLALLVIAAVFRRRETHEITRG